MRYKQIFFITLPEKSSMQITHGSTVQIIVTGLNVQREALSTMYLEREKKEFMIPVDQKPFPQPGSKRIEPQASN